ncbi:M12 family metallopeptidase [Phyllobacterium sp. LjRoot231]|uniref:M12 family metallopeptidase n=1 Tax=Phyllobacterium sp. LjRoot231 TaxID=3342289 RepID=UPI003ECCB27C
MSLTESVLKCAAGLFLASGIAALATGCANSANSTRITQDQVFGKPEEATGTFNKTQVISATFGKETFAVPYIVTADGYGIIQGDVIIGRDAQLQSTVGTFGLFLLNPRLWPLGIVKYKISSSLPDQNRVLRAIAHWERKTPIRFSRAGSAERNFVVFTRSSDRYSCSSEVGYHTGATPVILGDGCAYGNVVHEIGHVLGAAHEHMRSDQRRYITLHLENAKPDTEDNFKPIPSKYANFGNYCYGSIMHYPKDAFTKNNKPTIVPNDRNARIGQRDGLAPCDIDLIKTMYRSEFAKR